MDRRSFLAGAAGLLVVRQALADPTATGLAKAEEVKSPLTRIE
jgi:hypothetical protein